MMMQLFTGVSGAAQKLQLPLAYRKSVKWLPQIGDIFPNFEAQTTAGRLKFFDWADGHWTFLFSHPAAFTPVCTTEMVALAAAEDDFAAREIKLLGFTASPLDEQMRWHQDILDTFGLAIDFPMVDDHGGAMARAFGMIHEKESMTWPIRKSFILDPQMRIRMIFEYPIYVGRNTDEVLRAVDALKAVDEHDVAIPADWQPGDEFLCSEKHSPKHDAAKYGKRLQRLTSYLALIKPE